MTWEVEWLKFAVRAGGTLVLMLTSGLVFQLVLRRTQQEWTESGVSKSERDTGVVVGKCENVLVVILVLLGEYTALTLLFTGKAIVRREDLKSGNSLFYLAGTLVNISYSIVLALLLKWILRQLG